MVEQSLVEHWPMDHQSSHDQEPAGLMMPTFTAQSKAATNQIRYLVDDAATSSEDPSKTHHLLGFQIAIFLTTVLLSWYWLDI